MLNVMIVDDDVMFRYAVRTILDWESHGFKIVAEAINGRHALQLLENSPVDIIITDISMPEINGNDLIMEVKKSNPGIKFIVLSNYDDFAFVKDAMKFGAEDYILKMDLNKDDILRLLEQVRVKIREDRRREVESEYIKNKSSVIADSFFKKLISGELESMDEIKQEIAALNLKISITNLMVIVIEMVDGERFKTATLANTDVCGGAINFKRIMNLILSVMEEYEDGTVFSVDYGRIAIVLSFYGEKSEAKIRSKTSEIANKVKDAFNTCPNCLAGIGISNVCEKIENISANYTQCELALQYKRYDGLGKIFYFGEDSKGRTEETVFKFEFIEQIPTILSRLEKEEFCKELEHFFLEFSGKRLQNTDLKKVLFELLTAIYHAARGHNVDIKDILGAKSFPVEVLDGEKTIEEIKCYFSKLLLGLYDRMHSEAVLYKKEVQKVITYIHKNYMRDITLADVANALNFSPNYLSKFFKQETGLRLMEYINKVRINEAQKLLEDSDLKVYEIADRVGFSNTSYFCTVFKEVMGVTVSEFKNA